MVILLIKLKIILLITMSNNVSRQDLYDLTHKELGISKNECTKFVDLVFESILNNFEEGNKVKFHYLVLLMLKIKKLA